MLQFGPSTAGDKGPVPRRRSHWAIDLFCRNAGLCYGHATPRQKGTPGETSDAAQPRPHPHHPCRQPAAQRDAVRPADPARGGRGHRHRRAGRARWTRRCATSSTSRRRPASTSAMTASSSASASRPMCRSACPALPACRSARSARDFEEIPGAGRAIHAALPASAARYQNAPQAQAEIKYHDLKPIEDEIARFKPLRAEGHVPRGIHDRALARHRRRPRC